MAKEEKLSNKQFDMGSIISKLQKQLEDKNPALAKKVGVGSDLTGLEEKDFIKMPKWWQDATRTIGLPFGKLVMLAGDSDSGKSSAAVVAMKSAQQQGCGVIYVETEGKTTIEDLQGWGVDPAQILLIKASIAEEAFTLLFKAWDSFVQTYPAVPLLVVFDSLGNVVSLRDTEIDFTEQNQKPGGKGQINRAGLNNMVARRDDTNAAVLIINYTYDNIGSPGKTNAGGKAVNFFSCLTYQTTRKKWLEKVVKGDKQRFGAEVVWKLFKNHIDKRNPGPKEVTLRITAEGIEYVGGSNAVEE